MNDVAHTVLRHARLFGEPVGGDAERVQKLFFKNFAWVNRGMSRAIRFSSVVIGDFDAVGVTVSPDKTGTPLLIHADAVLPGPVMFESLETVAGQGTQRVKAYRRVQNERFTEGNPLQFGRQLARMPTTENPLGLFVGNSLITIFM